jgi:LuxR family maltose regulon positive regulatory protein
MSNSSASPPLGGLVDRPRLNAVLDEGHALTILSGSAGSGKSTLVSQWMKSQTTADPAIIAVSLDSEHSAQKSVWRLVLQALLDHHLTPDRAGVREDLRGFAGMRDLPGRLVELFAGLTDPCVLVIDNCNQQDARELFELLVRIVDAAPRLRVVVCTRHSSWRGLLDVIASVDSIIVGQQDLMLTATEARELIHIVAQEEPPADALGEVSALPITARIVGLAIRSGQWPSDGSTRGRAIVADALLANFLADIPDDFLRFLLETSVPTTVTSEVAAAIGWGPECAMYLERAEASGLGIWHSFGDAVGFSYSPLIREALARQFAQRSPESRGATYRAVAAWAFSRRRYVEALANALASGDYYLASRYARESWFPLTQTGAAEVVKLLRREDRLILIRFPTLSMMMALVLLVQGKRLSAHSYFDSAVRSSARQAVSDDAVERLWIVSIQSLGERFIGDFEEAAAHAQEAVSIIAGLSPQKRAGMDQSMALMLSNCGLSFIYSGQFDEAASALELGMTLQVSDDNAGWYHCASLLAGVHALRGDLDLARRRLAEIDEAGVPVHWQTDIFGFPEQLTRALIAIEEFDFGAAQRALDSVIHQLGETEHWAYHVVVQSHVYLLTGRAADALVVIDNALRRGANPKTSRVALDSVMRMRLYALLALGHRPTAQRAVDALPKAWVPTQVARAFFSLLACDFDDAFVALGRLVASHDSFRDRRIEVMALVTFAIAASRLGESKLGISATRRAIAMVRSEGMPAILLMFARADLAAIGKQAGGVESAYLDGFLATFRDREDTFEVFAPAVSLTAREQSVLRCLKTTSSVAAIAAELSVSPNTVKVQLRGLYRKLGASTRLAALHRAAELGLLEG